MREAWGQRAAADETGFMKIIIIGAGIVGLATARCLVNDGHDVTVIDRNAGPGLSSSYANGAQLSYSYVAPLADPSVWRQLPGLLVDRDSPVRFRAGFDPFQYRWLLQFLAACTERQANETIDRLGELAQLSRKVLHNSPDLMAAQFNWTASGKLVVYSSEKSFASARRYADRQVASGTDKRALGRDECLVLEPALASIGDRLVGGIFAPDDETADALLMCREMERLMAESGNPPQFLYNTEVSRFIKRGRTIDGLQTGHGRLSADMYILAAGVGSRPLGRQVGLDLPIYPIKGYSLSVPVAREAAAPRVSVTDAARKIVLARLGDTLRLAGAADIVGDGLDIDFRRTGKLIADARADFPDAADWQSAKLWAGLRPATPTGQPIVGPTRVDNLMVNVGHGALGFTLALGTAQRLADQIAGR
ncbi:D-amino acid dehydrogenase small subunit [Pelagibacterium halotolerans B2]|uniref:D-amino acid dehydrogenase small subunit n=2 Tax=Pelagibacterium TaxID=1082930 RepID=G4REK6_PELHB|nr:D-amino acid dehydrogenase small subunit [Pelagibacterium halotolerans B2]